jgi:hypothetical protein
MSFDLFQLQDFGSNFNDDFGFDDDFGGSFTDFNVPFFGEFSQEQFEFEDDFAPQSFFEQGGGSVTGFRGTADPRTLAEEGETLSTLEFARQFNDERSLGAQAKDFLFKTLGVGPETAKAISAFAKAANKGGGKQGQAQGRGRTGPALPTSARAPTTAAGRTSRARQATSGERAVQAAIQQSERATSAARAIANQMARAGTVTSTNDLADMISGSTKPMGTKQKLPGSNLRQLAIPRTQMA